MGRWTPPKRRELRGQVTTPQTTGVVPRPSHSTSGPRDRLPGPGWTERDLAWRLADRYRRVFVRSELTLFFVDLGVGEYFLAIQRILCALADAGWQLPRLELDMVQEWVTRYDRHRELGPIISSLKAPKDVVQQPQATSGHSRSQRGTT